MASPAEQLQAAKTLVRREVLRQVYVPLRVIAARLMLYYIPHYKGFDRPWISVRNAVAALRDSGAIMPEKVGDENWYHLPRTKPEKLQLARETQPPVYNAEQRPAPRRRARRGALEARVRGRGLGRSGQGGSGALPRLVAGPSC